MEYAGKYKAFDNTRIHTYPVTSRKNKVTIKDLIKPENTLNYIGKLPKNIKDGIDKIARHIAEARAADKPVILFTGAHLIKNGLAPLIIDLIKHNIITLVAGNHAVIIHDFELALIGQTSENVPNALSKGRFGMAYEFAYINTAISLGNYLKLGLGEAIGKMLTEPEFRKRVFDDAANENSPRQFRHLETSLIAQCYKNNVPLTIHAGISTDVTDQHPSFDGCAKGACSARDFLIFTEQVSHLTKGGVILNVGSAVTGPETLLKAASMAANVGKPPHKIITADFDIRPHHPQQMTDESAPGYYFRDQKSVLTRIPHAFDGKGFYINADQKQSIPLLYQLILEKSQDSH